MSRWPKDGSGLWNVRSMEGLVPSIVSAWGTKHFGQIRKASLVERANAFRCLSVSASGGGFEATEKLEGAFVLTTRNYPKTTNILDEWGRTGNDCVCILVRLGIEVDKPFNELSVASRSADIDDSPSHAARRGFKDA
jgi:hypothetical protein